MNNKNPRLFRRKRPSLRGVRARRAQRRGAPRNRARNAAGSGHGRIASALASAPDAFERRRGGGDATFACVGPFASAVRLDTDGAPRGSMEQPVVLALDGIDVG